MALNPNPQKQIHVSFAIATFSIFLGVCFHPIPEKLVEFLRTAVSSDIPKGFAGLVEISSPMFIFVLISKLMEEYLWKNGLFRKLFGISTPIIEGEWLAEFKSSSDNYAKVHAGTAYIEQTWSHLSVRLVGDNSRSLSEIAAIRRDEGNQDWLIYEYLSEPVVDAVSSMHAHRGTVRMSIAADSMVGEYYTGRDRKTDGTLELSRRRK